MPFDYEQFFLKKYPHLFGYEGKLETGVGEILFPEPLLAQVDDPWVMLYVVTKSPGGKNLCQTCPGRSSSAHLATPSKVTSSCVGPIPPEVSTRSKLFEKCFTSLRNIFFVRRCSTF